MFELYSGVSAPGCFCVCRITTAPWKSTGIQTKQSHENTFMEFTQLILFISLSHPLCPSALFLFGIFESWLAGVYSGTLFTLNTFSLHSNIFFYILISVRLYVFTGGATINTKLLSQSKKRNNSKNASSFRGPPEVEYGKINYTIKCTPTTL